MRKIILLFLICAIGILISVISISAQTSEEITITTYYPSPYGVYQEMNITGRQAIGDVNGDSAYTNADMAVDQSGAPIPGSLTVAGNVGIGTTNPQVALDVAGYINVGQWGTGGVDVCTGSGDNTLSKCVSSEKYKKDIENLNIGLEVVEKLKPVKFNWRANDKADLGFIAEDVEKVSPILVTYDDSRHPEGVKYRQITAVLVNAIKELKAGNEALEKRVKILEND